MREPVFDLRQKLAAEFTGTAFLVGTVVGSGIVAERLSDGNVGLALYAARLFLARSAPGSEETGG